MLIQVCWLVRRDEFPGRLPVLLERLLSLQIEVQHSNRYTGNIKSGLSLWSCIFTVSTLQKSRMT